MKDIHEVLRRKQAKYAQLAKQIEALQQAAEKLREVAPLLAENDDDDTAVRENKSGRDAQFVGENGEFVGAPVAVGVLANLEPVVPLAGRLKVVRIIYRLGDPEASAFIPGEPDGFHDVRLRRKEAHLEVGKRDQMFHRLGRFELLLHGADRFALRAPTGVRRVVGQRRRRFVVGSVDLKLSVRPPIVARRPPCCALLRRRARRFRRLCTARRLAAGLASGLSARLGICFVGGGCLLALGLFGLRLAWQQSQRPASLLHRLAGAGRRGVDLQR